MDALYTKILRTLYLTPHPLTLTDLLPNHDTHINATIQSKLEREENVYKTCSEGNCEVVSKGIDSPQEIMDISLQSSGRCRNGIRECKSQAFIN